MNKKLKRMLMAGTLFTTGLLGAGEMTQQDNRNGFEKGMYATTQAVNTGVHATTETALYPMRFASWLLSEAGRSMAQGINWIGEKTGTESVTNIIGKGVSFPTNMATATIDSTAQLAQSVTEDTAKMGTAFLNAGATATRDPNEALKNLGKESLVGTSDLLYQATATPTSLANLGITGAEDLARTAAVGGAEMTAKGVGLVDSDTGAQMQENIDVANGAAIAGQTANFMARNLVLNAPAMAARAMPLLNKEIRDDMINGIKQAIETAQETQTAPAENNSVFSEVVQDTVKDVQDMSAKGVTPSKLKSFLAKFGKGVKKAEKEALKTPTPIPKYNPFNRDGGR